MKKQPAAKQKTVVARAREPISKPIKQVPEVPAADVALPAAAPPATPTWTAALVPLGTLLPWPRNPRRISEQQAARLRESFDEFGQVETIAIGPDAQVYNGHQRLKVLLAQHGPDHMVEARVCSRTLTEKEQEKLTIYLHRGAAGEFDLELLAREFDPIELDAWGMTDLNIPDTPEAEWQAMPEFDGAYAHKKLTVYLQDDAAIASFSAAIGQAVTADMTSVWYPPRERRDLHTQIWKSDAES